MKKVLVINGPNLNLLGKREISIYGEKSLNEIIAEMKKECKKLDLTLETFQSNSEGEIVSKIGKSIGKVDAVIINPGAYTHTSVAIRDAISATNISTIEVHLSNIYKREEFRHKSLIAPVALGQISGFGWYSYILALYAVRNLIREDITTKNTKKKK